MSVKTAYKALSLKSDPIFKLLMTMLVLLGWLIAMGGASIVSFENVYKQWNLTQKSRVNVYILAQTEQKDIDELSSKLLEQDYVEGIKHIQDQEIKDLLDPFLLNDLTMQLPKILELQTTKANDFVSIKKIVEQKLPNAQVDDPSSTLNSIADGVRFAEGITFVISLIILFVISLIVSLTTRAGLRAQKRQVEILQYVGASDTFIALLTVKQVLFCSIVGYLGSVTFSALSIIYIKEKWPLLESFVLGNVWFVAFIIPLFVCIVTVLVSMLVAKQVIKGS